MDIGSIALAAACMIGVCGVGMWLMMRGGSWLSSRRKQSEDESS